MTPDEQFVARRKSRNVAIGLMLGFFALLFFAITLVHRPGH